MKTQEIRRKKSRRLRRSGLIYCPGGKWGFKEETLISYIKSCDSSVESGTRMSLVSLSGRSFTRVVGRESDWSGVLIEILLNL